MADIRIRGAKAGQKEPRKPNISKDTAASISTAKLLYGLAEGEIYGLADGAKSIRLDGTPLVDDAGNPNFEGVTWDFRNGSNDQEYIKGFPDVSNETPINVELRSSQPWIKAFNDTQISAVRVRFKWNRLSETNGENGDVKGYKIDYAIDLQTDGGAYQTVLTTKIQDKTSAGYERTHRIDLPKAKTGWQLRVRRITPNSTSDLIQDTMMIDAVAEVIDVKLSYPNTALLGVQYNAELFSNIAKMSVRLKGKIIRVPDNYDPVARTYTGIWTGKFKEAYSNNPAWVFYDLCTQWRGGLGERLDATMIDRWSLYALGQYCDQPVSDGQGGLEPRFTCNVYLQKQEEAYTVLQNIAGIFRAMSFWTGERIMLDADVPQDSIYTYSSANIVGGVAGIQYSGTRNRDRHTLAKVAWDNPNNDYQTEYEYIRDEKAMSKFGVKVLDLSAFGCTSQAQAQRAGLWALKTEQLETRQVTFSVGLDGAIPRVGNIISLSDEAFAGRANGGRVSTVNSTQRIIELDREVVASVGDTLIINGGSGKSERRNISNVVGNRITVTAPFTSAEPEHVWAIETVDLKLMRFRVMSITENDDATYAITAIQHEPQKYDAIDFGTDVKPTEITIINPDTVDAPASVTVTSRHREVQGQTLTTLVISWSQVKGAVAYDAEWRKDDGTWVKVPRTGNVSVEIDGVYSGNYMARVRAISAFDVQSRPTTSALTAIKGKIGLPPTIVGLTATGILFGMDLKWGFAQGSGDAAYTEIQVGSAPDVNVATLTQVSYPTNTHTVTGLQGNLKQSYRARLVDKLGFKSAWSAWVTGTTDASADKIMDLIQGQIDESSLNQILTSKIADIKINKDAISKETQDRIQAIIDLNKLTEKAVADVDVEYYLSSSATTPTGGEWLTKAPAWQQSKFMFSRTKTTLADGTVSYTPSVNGTNITGAKGDKGDKGEQGVAGRDGRNGIDGVNGIDGLEGAEGKQGIQGEKGADGKSSYTHLAYGTSSTGAGFSVSHYPNATYIGMYVDDLPTDSSNPSKYKWSLIKGADGSQGVEGKKGADGLTPYFHVAYATNATGTQGFSVIESLGKTYIGQYTDYTLEDSPNPSRYKWTLIKGADGKDGKDGLNGVNGLEGEKGEQGIQGVAGKDGKSSYTHLAYATGASGQGFSKSHFTNATYIGMYVDNLPDDSDVASKYKWSLIKGADGAQGIEGQKGADGLTPYLHIAYATNATGSIGFSTKVSTGKTYIGQYTDNTKADSNDPTKYKWTLIKGEQGAAGKDGYTPVKGVDYFDGIKGADGSDGDSAYQSWLKSGNTGTTTDFINYLRGQDGKDGKDGIAGAKGADGITYYTWVKYADSADGTIGFSNNPNNKPYIGFAFNKTKETESTNPRDYTWSLIKGSQGDKGNTGQGVESIVEQYGISKIRSQVPTTWTETVPEWVKGDYVWTRSEITYKDPHEVRRTDPIIDPAWDAISVTNTSFINFKEKTEGDFHTQGELLDGIISDYRPEYFDKTKYFSSVAEQWTYAKTVAASNYAANERITNLQSEFAHSNANVTQTLFTLTEQDKAIASDVSQLYAKTNENYGLIQEVSIAISKPESGLAAKVAELQGRAAAAEVLLTEKGEIIFSYGAPPVKKEDKNNVWFKLKNEDNGTVSQTPHQWNGSAWVELKDSAALAAKADAAAAKTAAENKGEVIYSGTTPSADKQKAQNLWIDTSLVGGKPVNTPKRWNGSAWVAVTDKAVVDAQSAANAAAEAAGNKGEVIYSATTPSADKQKAQNLWIDTSGGKNTPKRWAAGAWLTVTDKAAIDAQAAADKANTSLLPANLASLVQGSGAFSDEFGSISGQFANFEAVIEGQKTAMEVISGIGNAEKLKNEIAKARLDKNVTNLNAQSTALTTQINGYTTKIADVTAKRNATTDTALKAEYNKLITDLTAARTDLTAQKAVIADQVAQLAAEKKVLDDFKEVEDGVRSQHTVKIDNAGKVVGFGLVLQKNGFSAFDVRADRFSISAPSDKPNDVNGNSPFMVLTNPQVIDGVQVPAGTYMRNFYAPKGSIDTLQVKEGAIDTLQVKEGAIKSAQIDDLAVTSGKIAKLAVDTLQIAGNAITVSGIFYAEQDTHFNIAKTPLEVAFLNVDSAGGTVSIDFGFDSMRVYRYGGSSSSLVIQVLRGTEVLREKSYAITNSTGSMEFGQQIFLPIVDKPDVGINRYSVVASIINSRETDVRLSMTARTLVIRGAKDDRG